MSDPGLFRVYVDESGDRGTSEASMKAGRFFILGGLVVRDTNDERVRSARDKLCRDFGVDPAAVLSWKDHAPRKHHSRRVHIASTLAAEPMRLVYVIVDKSALQQTDQQVIYNYALRLLYERISWLVGSNDGRCVVNLAHVRRMKSASVYEYLEKLRSTPTQIRWAAMPARPNIVGQSDQRLLNLSDVACGILRTALMPDQFGHYEAAYLHTVAPLVYNSPGGDIRSYGMKVFGNNNLLLGYPWWPQFVGLAP